MQYTDSRTVRPDGDISIVVTIPQDEIGAAKTKAFESLKKTVTVQGFRKGNAPDDMARKHIGESAILEEASKELLTEIYSELLKKYDLRPYIDPKVSLLKAEADKPWEIEFIIASAPKLSKVPEYKKIAHDIRSEEKKDAIWTPGKEEKKDEDESKKRDMRLQKILDGLMKQTELTISPLIVEYEVNRRLVGLYEEIAKLGMTVEQYLSAKQTSKEALRASIEKEIKDMYTIELLLDEIADAEKITVDNKEVEDLEKKAKNDEERRTIREQSYFYTRILRKQKTLDYIATL